MTVEQLCALFNLAGVLVPVAFSIGVAFFYEELYFRLWTVAYGLLFICLTCEVFAGRWDHPFWLTAIEVVTYIASGWLCLRMGDDLVGRRPRLAWGLVITATVFASYCIQTALGAPFDRAVIPTILYYIGTQVVLGIQMWRSATGPGLRWIGLLTAVTALWVMAYPTLSRTPYLWAGFVVAGMLHLTLGMAMMLYLLANIANKLRKHNEELQVVEKLQAEFIGIMSHEFRTPLNALKTAAFILKSMDADRLSPQQREVVGIIDTNVERFIGLVGDVLDYSKLESGTMVYDLQPHALGRLLRDATQAQGHLFAEKGVTLELSLPEGDITADVDQGRLGQVLANLLSNALKFTPPGGQVTVKLMEEAMDARIEVRDTGSGISPELRERIFTKFFQADASNTRKAGGAGLGLSICRAIVEDGHHGRIWAEDNHPGAALLLAVPIEQPKAIAVPRSLPEPKATKRTSV